MKIQVFRDTVSTGGYSRNLGETHSVNVQAFGCFILKMEALGFSEIPVTVSRQEVTR